MSVRLFVCLPVGERDTPAVSLPCHSSSTPVTHHCHICRHVTPRFFVFGRWAFCFSQATVIASGAVVIVVVSNNSFELGAGGDVAGSQCGAGAGVGDAGAPLHSGYGWGAPAHGFQPNGALHHAAAAAPYRQQRHGFRSSPPTPHTPSPPRPSQFVGAAQTAAHEDGCIIRHSSMHLVHGSIISQAVDSDPLAFVS